MVPDCVIPLLGEAPKNEKESMMSEETNDFQAAC